MRENGKGEVVERWKKFCVEIDGVNCNNICPLGTGLLAFFVSLVVFCYIDI